MPDVVRALCSEVSDSDGSTVVPETHIHCLSVKCRKNGRSKLRVEQRADVFSNITRRIEFEASKPTGELQSDDRDDGLCADNDTNAEADAVVDVGASVEQHNSIVEAVASTEVDEREPLHDTPPKKHRADNPIFAAFLKGAKQ